MNHEQQEVGGQLSSGQYFKEARSWYATLYISPISERAFFLVVLVLAGLIAFVGFIAFLRFMPLAQSVPVMIYARDVEAEVPKIVPLRPSGAELASSVERFLIAEYVLRREGYSAAQYEGAFAFVRAHTDPTNFASYEAVYGRANPRSPASILGKSGRRVVSVDTISTAEEGDFRQAVVGFSTELEGVGAQAKTEWTATLTYYYSPMQIAEEQGDDASVPPQVDDPQFKVVSYVVSQTP